jgi:cell wall-associated NlpC family hydrolase
MRLRINPIVLLGLIIALILTGAVFASAQGGSPGDAVAAAMSQVGKPYAFSSDGPNTFSCAGLMRYALRVAGVDANAPWSHGGFLSAYPNDATPQVGDIVVYDSGVGMYIGNDTVVMANAADGVVGTYPMNSIGTILGFANPYGGTATPAATDTKGVGSTPLDTTGVGTGAPLDTTGVGTGAPLDTTGQGAAPLTDTTMLPY